MFTIGCHLSCAKGYAQMAKDAQSIGANTFQFFTRNPRGGKAKDISAADIAEFETVCADAGIETILAHAPYTLNPCALKPDVADFAREVMADDLARMEATPGQFYNMHPGSHVKQGADVGIEKIAQTLNEVIQPAQTTTVLLETMAGKGTEVGRTFDEIARIIERVDLVDHVGVCLDTCHVWDGGYDIVDDLDGVLDEFDAVIGLERLKAIHLNDSKNERASHKDRHAAIGEGCITANALIRLTAHPRLRHLPFFLETPQDDLAGWGAEIALIREEREAYL